MNELVVLVPINFKEVSSLWGIRTSWRARPPLSLEMVDMPER